MKKIPELSAPVLRTISPKDVPAAPRLAVAVAAVREKRPDIADVFEFMSLSGMRWGEVRAMRVSWLSEVPFPQLVVESSHSDNYEEKVPKSWRGTRAIPLSPRAVAIFTQHATGKDRDEYQFTNKYGRQLNAGVVRKFPLGFHRHALRHYAASTWLRLGTPVHEVAEYLGDDPRTVLAVYAHILGEGQRRAHIARLAGAEEEAQNQAGDTRGTPGAQIG